MLVSMFFPRHSQINILTVISHTRSICLSVILHLTILATLGEEYKLWRTSLCNFPYSSFTPAVASKYSFRHFSQSLSLIVRENTSQLLDFQHNFKDLQVMG
jgi:DTW domain-containing protein YfiP